MSFNKKPFFTIDNTELSIDLFIYPAKTRFKVGLLKLSIEDRELTFNTKEPYPINDDGENYSVDGKKVKVKKPLNEIDLWADNLKITLETSNPNLDAILVVKDVNTGHSRNFDVTTIIKK